MPARRTVLKFAAVFGLGRIGDGMAQPARQTGWSSRLVEAAHAQVGVTVSYDPAYVDIAYPNGDVPSDRGVCTDVIIRAYRDSFGLDLQQLVHEDMRASFAAYPRHWGLKRPDTNIDHRRVPNLETFFRRKDAALPITTNAIDWQPGDLISQRLPAGQPHIGIVSDRMNQDGTRPLVVHNIGAGTRVEDILFTFPVVGHFRYRPPTATAA